MKSEALLRFVGLWEPLQCRVEDYLRERAEWREALRLEFESAASEDGYEWFPMAALVTVEVCRHQSWPWVRDLLEAMPPDELKRQADGIPMRDLVALRPRLNMPSWRGAEIGEPLNGSAARLALAQAAVDWGLADASKVLIGTGQARWSLLGSLMIDPKRGRPVADYVQHLTGLGISRGHMLSACFHGHLIQLNAPGREGYPSKREMLLAITDVPPLEAAPLLNRMREYCRYATSGTLAGWVARPGNLEMICEVRDRLAHRLSLGQAAPIAPLMMAP